jgi:hypothetical protein
MAEVKVQGHSDELAAPESASRFAAPISHTTREAVMAARVGCNGSFHSDILNVP